MHKTNHPLGCHPLHQQEKKKKDFEKEVISSRAPAASLALVHRFGALISLSASDSGAARQRGSGAAAASSLFFSSSARSHHNQDDASSCRTLSGLRIATQLLFFFFFLGPLSFFDLSFHSIFFSHFYFQHRRVSPANARRTCASSPTAQRLFVQWLQTLFTGVGGLPKMLPFKRKNTK